MALQHEFEDPKARLKKDRDISRKLYYTWTPFFSRFDGLTEVQRQTIPQILEGKDVLVCSPTASGKTEAVCAPAIERNYLSNSPWKILYISPTRALINDLYFRLIDPVGQLGLRISRRTGDHHQRLEDAKIVLTTPESFDSILCRGKTENGHVLADVSTLVFDEVHFLIGTPRGEQLKWLIQRLILLKAYALKKRWIEHNSLQRIVLSATISNPNEVISDYLDKRNAHHVNVCGGRRIEVVWPEDAGPTTEDALIKYLKNSNKSEKILVFCNSRKRVDSLLNILTPPMKQLSYIPLAHHGSLSKPIREEAEETIKNQRRVILIATSTLEIGVDIGDIDLIVLDGPAPDITSLLQRIGRGNRRTNSTRIMPCFGSFAEFIIHSSMIEAARANRLHSKHFGPCHAVAVQQVASYVFQAPKRSRSKEKVEKLIQSCVDPEVSKNMLDHFLDTGEMIQDYDGVRLSRNWLDKSERGDIHSNIESSLGTVLIDDDTGKIIATGLNVRDGKVMKLAGKLMEMKKKEGNKVYVGHLKEKIKPDAAWGYHSKYWMKGSGQPQAVRHYLGLKIDEWPIIHLKDTSFIFHFGGARRKAVLKLAIKDNQEVRGFVSANEWYIKLKGYHPNRPVWLEGISPNILMLKVTNMLEGLEKILARPYANRKMPLNVRIHEIMNWLSIEAELKSLEESSWQVVTDKEISFALESLTEH